MQGPKSGAERIFLRTRIRFLLFEIIVSAETDERNLFSRAKEETDQIEIITLASSFTHATLLLRGLDFDAEELGLSAGEDIVGVSEDAAGAGVGSEAGPSAG